MRNAVLVSAVRSPVGKKGGVFRTISRMDLFVPVIHEALNRIDLDPSEVEETIFGNNPEARTPARYAWLYAGLPVTTAGLTINRACGTGLTGLNIASSYIKSGFGDVYMCGGIEFDSKPMPLVRSTNPYGNGTIAVLPKRSSTDEYGNPNMIDTAENVAKKYEISREDCDEYAARSQALALKGYEIGLYPEHVVPISVPQKKADPIVIDRDEILRPGTTVEILSKLRTIRPEGVVTGGNSSPLNDGSSAGIMMEEEKARSMGIKPLMRFIDYAVVGVDPRYMGLGPVTAVPKVLKRNNMTLDDIDFIECNEAFAAQTLGVQRLLNIPMEKLNIYGGAIGHPYSATGISLAAKAAGIFKRHPEFERCIITFCCGGGQGVATIFERCE